MNKKDLGGAASKLFSTPSVKAETENKAEEVKETTAPELTPEERAIKNAELHSKRVETRGREPKSEEEKASKTDARTSVIIDKIQLAKIREIALRETLTQKEIFNLALGIVIERYEKKHGVINITPQEKRDLSSIF